MSIIYKKLLTLLLTLCLFSSVYAEARVVDKLFYKGDLAYAEGEDKSYTGSVVRHYSNGKKMVEYSFMEGLQEGMETWWREDGSKKTETNYKQDKVNGLSTSYCNNGQKRREVNYVDGKKSWEIDFNNCLSPFLQAQKNNSNKYAVERCNPYFDKECKHKSTINLPFKDTVYWYQQAAEKGNAEAQSGLGMLYFQGKGVKQSDELAIKWLIESAKQGRKSAQHNLAVMYLEGIGVEKNYKKSFEWFSRAAKQDYAPSQKSLSNFYRKGLGVEKNTKLADTWFERSKMSGPYNDGLSLYKKGDYESAFKLLKPLADNLHNMAMFYIGVMYEYGKGVEMDYDKAIKYYRDPAHQGVPEAQFNLGRLFLGNAVGVDKDVKTAFRWIERSANQGMAQAQYDLALMYHYGEGVAVDAKKAFELFKKSAEQGYADAKNNLSVFYERGIGVDKNAEKAQYWREKSR